MELHPFDNKWLDSLMQETELIEAKWGIYASVN